MMHVTEASYMLLEDATTGYVKYVQKIEFLIEQKQL